MHYSILIIIHKLHSLTRTPSTSPFYIFVTILMSGRVRQPKEHYLAIIWTQITRRDQEVKSQLVWMRGGTPSGLTGWHRQTDRQDTHTGYMFWLDVKMRTNQMKLFLPMSVAARGGADTGREEYFLELERKDFCLRCTGIWPGRAKHVLGITRWAA